MKSLGAKSLSLAVLFAACSTVAFAAPSASISCTGKAAATANLSFYELSATTPVATGGATGAGAGKTTFSPLVVHAALSQFASFYPAFTEGVVIPTCVLTSTAGGGSFKIDFKDVFISSVTATASDGAVGSGGTTTASAYLEISFVYKTFTVEASGPDDGGKAAVFLPNTSR